MPRLQVTCRMLAAAAGLLATLTVPALTPPAGAAVTAGPGPSVGPTDFVAYETGAGSINSTDTTGNVAGTDLGISWDDGQGHVLVAYGDSFGATWTPPARSAGGGPEGGDWRSNFLAVSSDRHLADGMSFDSLVTDRAGHAKEILPSKKQPNVEQTVIPTAGISVGTRQYLAYMSVNHWGPGGGVWATNHAGLAYSDDDGRTWVKDAVTWPNADGNDPFQQAALVRRGGFVYLYGTRNGRFGPAFVARVAETRLLDKSAYEYWTGTSWAAGPDTQARPVVDGTVAELSVQWNDYLGQYLMMYIDPDADALVLRRSPSPQGPWSDETIVQRSAEYPSLYGGFLHPWSSGRDLYFSMSQWAPYNTFLMHATLSGGKGDPTPDVQNALRDSGFESTVNPWLCAGTCGTDTNTAFSHSGTGNAWVRHDSGWNDVHQTVAVRPNTTYRLSGWLRTSANSDSGYFGVRTPGGAVLGEKHFTRLAGYQRLTVDVPVGADGSVVVFGGVWTNSGDIYLQLDDVSLVPVG